MASMTIERVEPCPACGEETPHRVTVSVEEGESGRGRHPRRKAECLVCEDRQDARANHPDNTRGVV